MIVKLLTEHHLEFLSLKEAAEAHPSLHMSKCHIVGNLMPWLILFRYLLYHRRRKNLLEHKGLNIFYRYTAEMNCIF